MTESNNSQKFLQIIHYETKYSWHDLNKPYQSDEN